MSIQASDLGKVAVLMGGALYGCKVLRSHHGGKGLGRKAKAAAHAAGDVFKGDGIGKQVCTNVDFYSGFVYEAIGLPKEIYTPMFAMSRVTGWAAHRIEELNFASKRIIRPAYKNVGERKSFTPLKDR
jgi:citrate synthase